MHVVPAALAVAQARHRSGRELLDAVLVGYEATARLFEAFRNAIPGAGHDTWERWAPRWSWPASTAKIHWPSRASRPARGCSRHGSPATRARPSATRSSATRARPPTRRRSPGWGRPARSSSARPRRWTLASACRIRRGMDRPVSRFRAIRGTVPMGRRIQFGLGQCCRLRGRARGAGRRHGRQHSHPGGILRSHRLRADLRCRAGDGLPADRPHTRPDRSDRGQRPRLRAAGRRVYRRRRRRDGDGHRPGRRADRRGSASSILDGASGSACRRCVRRCPGVARRARRPASSRCRCRSTPSLCSPGRCCLRVAGVSPAGSAGAVVGLLGEHSRAARCGVSYDVADYLQAQRVRRVGQEAVGRLFREADLVVTPTACTTATSLSDIGALNDKFGIEPHSLRVGRVLECDRQPGDVGADGFRCRRAAARPAHRRPAVRGRPGPASRDGVPGGHRLASATTIIRLTYCRAIGYLG